MTSPEPQPQSLASVTVPTEHGGWSLTLEPVVLGLIVAPTAAGFALGAAALAAFVLRTPAKLVLVDRYRKRRLPRTRLAERVAAVELAVLVVLLGVAATGNRRLWIPLLLAAPIVVVELWYDARSRSRRLAPELAGTIAIGSVAAAIALAGGEPWSVAAGLWAVVAARSVAAVPFVRLQLLRRKERPFSARASDAAQVAAVGIVTAGFAAGAVPVAGAVAIAGLAAFHLAAARLRAPAAPVIGAQQVALGLGVVLATGLGVLAP